MRRLGVAATVVLVSACADSIPTTPTATARSIGASAASLTSGTLFSETFLRTAGPPNLYVRTFSTAGFTAPFTLHVRNGSASGSNRVSSGTVSLDGNVLLSPSDFSQQAAEWTIPIALGASGTLSVWVASKPGSYLEISVEGTPSGFTLFCPDARPGSIPDLSDAVDATPVDGTVLVCDGTWRIDEELVSKPVSIRSQNPGGATLQDTDSTAIGQGGRPAIRIDGIPSGMVRIVDLTFEVHGRAILAAHTYDRLEIDSSTFVGLDSLAGFMIWPDSSLVPTAYVEVKNSRFDGGSVGVFPVRGIRADVHHNLFERQRVSGVIHSGGGVSLHAHGSVTDNVFRHCGAQVCLRSFASNVVIARNRIEMPVGVSRLNALQFVRLGVTPVPLPIVIEDNEIIGGVLPGVPTSPTSWTVQNAIRVQDQSGVQNIVRRNRATNAHTFLTTQFSSVGSMVAHDNVFSNGVFAVQSFNSVAVLFNRNDATGLLNSFNGPVNAGTNYTCNWWGSVAGPVTPPGTVAASVYAPWAMSPIANQPGVVCP